MQPVVKTTIKASTSQRTLKSKSISGQNKSKPTSTIASKDEEKVSSSLSDNSSVVFSNDASQRHQPSDGECSMKTDLSELIPENNSVVISDDANQRHRPSDGESSLKTDLSELIPRKSSSRRKSYTTSLMEKSKVSSSMY
jgi:G2/mitotic-specific cyclin-B, other